MHPIQPTRSVARTARGVRRIALTTVLALGSASTLLMAGSLGLTAAHAQNSASAPRGMPGPGDCGPHGHRGEAGMPFGPFGGGRGLDRMLNEVQASDAQRTQIKQIAEAARKDLQADHAAGRGLHEKMLQIMSAPTVDAAAAESVRQQMLALHDQVSKRALQAMLDISRALTPEQRAQLAQHMKDRPWHRGAGQPPRP